MMYEEYSFIDKFSIPVIHLRYYLGVYELKMFIPFPSTSESIS